MKKFFFIALVSLVVMACSKTENPPTNYLDFNKYNIAGNYKVTGLTFKTSDSLEFDAYNIDTVYKQCKKDDIIGFDTNWVYTYVDTSGTICDTLFNDFSHQYAISNTNLLSGVRIIEPYQTGYFTYVINSLTTSKLVLSRNITLPFLGSVINGTVKVTLTKQP